MTEHEEHEEHGGADETPQPSERRPAPREEPPHRPGDAARRALRAAREGLDPDPAERTQAEPAQEAPSREEPAPTSRAATAARPSDAARAALRRAVAARRDTAHEGHGPAPEQAPSVPPDAEPDASAPSGTPGGPPPEGDAPPAPSTPSRRAADGVREALRAAREDRERTRAEPDGTRRPRRPEAALDPGTPHARRARDVRRLLADAFLMPTGDTPSDADAIADAPEGPAAPQPPGAPAPRETGRTPPGPSAPADPPAHRHPASTPSAPPPPVPSPSAPPAAPQVPRSMAAPGRDGELRRTFPAFAPRPRDGSGFAGTWWGNAWVSALERGALDVKRLARGRGYAEQGNVDAITVTPGLVLAYVRGSRPRPYRAQVRLRTLDDEDWARFLDAVAERPGHIAALLDKEMPRSLAECGVPLLPAPGDLDPLCSCPDRGHPCKHAAALCYQTARLLDADPFVLLLLRGRGERELLDALSRLSAARTAREREPQPEAGVRATDALDAQRRLPPLPAPLPAPPHPEQPPVLPAAPDGPDAFALDQLATDATVRAHALLTTGRDPVGGLTLWQDAVRLAAARPGAGLTAATRALYSSLASAAGRTPADLARAVAAWRQGGPEGLAVLEEPWDPPAGRFDRARPLLLAADLPAFRPRRNHLTHPRGHVQLRFGRDGLWYPYESEPGRDDWWPRGTPDLDPVGALTGLGAAPED